MSLTTDDRKEIRRIATEVVDEFAETINQTFKQTFKEIKLNKPLCSLTLLKETHRCLSGARIYTITNLVSQTEVSLKNIKGFGPTCIQDVKEKLESAGLRLERLDIKGIKLVVECGHFFQKRTNHPQKEKSQT